MTRRRRLLLATGLVAALAVGGLVWRWGPESEVAVVPARAPSAPADPGPAGSWVLTHRFELPAGWTLLTQRIEARSSTSELAGPPKGGPSYCSVTVQQPGETMARPESGPRGSVRGAPSVYAARDRDRPDAPYGVYWQGPDGGRARAWCAGGRAPSLALAQQVRFTSTPVRVPLRFERLPGGYHAEAIVLRPAEAGAEVRLLLRPDVATLDTIPLVGYTPSGPLTGGRDVERVVLAGRPAELRALSRQICVADGQTLCVGEEAVDSMGNSENWPSGVRGLLLDSAEGLVGAERPDDRSTWFEGRRAFPG